MAISARGAQLCLTPSDLVVSHSSIQRWGQVTLRARRGDILDRDGRRLATTSDAPTIVVDPALVTPEELGSLSRKVADILHLPAGEVAEKLGRDSRYARLASRVHPKVAQEIDRLNHRALWHHADPRRYYPEGALGAQVLGFVDGVGGGRAGIESALDDHLRGGSILLQHRRDKRGYDADPWQADQTPGDGLDVHTTIDRTLQRVAERALAGAVERHAPHAAYATVIDVKTGDILAMANMPVFNPNQLGDDPSVRRNHAVQDAVEAGSVLKPFTLAAAIEEGVVAEHSPVDCENGAWYIGRTRIRDDHPHGVITASEVIKFSSNIGVAKMAFGVGAESFLGYYHAFGFGARTEIGLPGERRGMLRNAATIKPIELATTAFGQGMTSTQLQLAMATAALANDGLLMRPRLITLIEDADSVPVWDQRPESVRQVVSPETARAVARAMTTVTEAGGTGGRARVPGYKVAGKTGTAEKVKDGRYSDARIGSFMGFLPADNPRVAIVVTVDEPTKGSRYGGTVAGPVFSEIGAAAMRHYGIPPNPELLEAPEERWFTEVALAEVDELALDWSAEGWRVPDVSGRPVRDVLRGLQGAGLEVRVRGTGLAVSQEPAAGASVRPGEPITITFN